MKRILTPLLFLWAGIAGAQQVELLDPDQAFALSVDTQGADSLLVTWKIAEGYYLYRNKIKFSLDGAGVTLKPVTLPAGKKKNDPFFGELEVFFKELRVPLPLERSADATRTVTLTATSQGCNEPRGVCYPPQTEERRIELAALESRTTTPPADTLPPAPQSLTSLNSLISRNAGLSGAGGEFLDPDEAFRLSIVAIDAGRLYARIEIADNYYLYRDKTSFQGDALDAYALPAGETKDDPYFGKQQVYHNSVDVALPLKPGPAKTVTVLADYQGCADDGICYPPIQKTLQVSLADVGAPPAGSAPGGDVRAPPGASPASDPAPLSEDQRVTTLLESGDSYWWTLGFFLLAGLGLSMTPCVFPMIPILSGILVGQGNALSGKRAFFLSLVYVLAMALTYTVAGVVAALFGENVQAIFQDPWILAGFAIIFVLLALSMFGFYELQLPASIQSKLAGISNRQESGTLAGVAVMGVLSALIVGPCVAAPLAGALIYIGQSGDVLLGGSALFIMSLGMGVPLLLIGASAGKLLPRVGPWMDVVKAVFGVLLLAVAVWMLARVLPIQVTLVLYALLLIIPAVYLRALDTLPAGAGGWTRLWKGTGLVMLIYGLMLLVGAFTGARDPLDPLVGLQASTRTTGTTVASAPGGELKMTRVKGPQELKAKLDAAAGRPTMLDFYADWCVECVRLENTTFRDPAVHQALSGFQVLQSDVTPNDARDKALLKQFGLYGPPAILFFDSRGREQRKLRIIGYKNAGDFLDVLRQFDDAVQTPARGETPS